MAARIGDRAMTAAEKQRAYRGRVRERQAVEAEARAAVPRSTRTEAVAPAALTQAATKIVEGIRLDPEQGATWLRRVLGRAAFHRWPWRQTTPF